MFLHWKGKNKLKVVKILWTTDGCISLGINQRGVTNSICWCHLLHLLVTHDLCHSKDSLLPSFHINALVKLSYPVSSIWISLATTSVCCVTLGSTSWSTGSDVGDCLYRFISASTFHQSWYNIDNYLQIGLGPSLQVKVGGSGNYDASG